MPSEVSPGRFERLQKKMDRETERSAIRIHADFETCSAFYSERKKLSKSCCCDVFKVLYFLMTRVASDPLLLCA